MRLQKSEVDIDPFGGFKTGSAEKGEASEGDTMDKLSTRLESEHPAQEEIPAQNRLVEKVKTESALNKRKSRVGQAVDPAQMKKDLCKKLDSNMEWIKKRISKETHEARQTKVPIKLHFHQTVYQVDNESPKVEQDTKKLYKDLKESFNLLYPTEMSDHHIAKMRKIGGLQSQTEVYSGADDAFRHGKPSTRQDISTSINGIKKDSYGPRQSSLMESKRMSNGATPKKDSISRLDEIRAKDRGLSGTLKPRPELGKPGTMENLVTSLKQKPTHQKSPSHQVGAPKKQELVSSAAKSMSRKPQQTLMTSEKRFAQPKSYTIEAMKTKESEPDELKPPVIASIHKSISNYYTKNFIKNGHRLLAASKSNEGVKDAADMTEDTNRSHGTKVLRSQSNRRDTLSSNMSYHGASESQLQQGGLESFYRLVFETSELVGKPMSYPLRHFIKESIRTMQDFCNRFPRGAPAPDRVVNLPGKDKKKKHTILFDLDETLVHCSLEGNIDGQKLTLNKGAATNQVQASLLIRPHAREVLRELAQDFEVLVFTSSNKDYAKEVVKRLDPKMEFISFLLHREHCNIRSNVAIKDLRVIKNRDIQNMLIVDNCVGSFGNQLSNGIPILPFRGDKNDRELVHLAQHIRRVVKKPNFVEANSGVFGLANIRFCKDPAHYVEQLVRLASLHDTNGEQNISPKSEI